MEVVEIFVFFQIIFKKINKNMPGGDGHLVIRNKGGETELLSLTHELKDTCSQCYKAEFICFKRLSTEIRTAFKTFANLIMVIRRQRSRSSSSVCIRF